MLLKASATSGVKWSSLSLFGRRGVSFLTSVALARLLTPSDFGLIAMSSVIIGFIEVFRDMGTATAVIQRKHASQALLSSVFWLNLLFGCLAMVCILFISTVVGKLYRNDHVVPILKVLSISFPLSGLGILQQALMVRRLEFETLAKLEFFTAVVASIIGVACAMHGMGAWSLVSQMITGTMLTTALLWRYAGWRPDFAFNWNEAKSVMHFSLNLT